MRKLLLLSSFAFLLSTTPARADDPAAILGRVDRYRSPLASFSIDIELTSFAGSKSETTRMRVFGKGDDRSVVEFTYPQSEKGKSLLMLRDAMWIYLPSASKPIRISPLQRLMGQASNGDVARTSFTVDYKASSVAEAREGDRDAWLLELAAKDPAVAYKRVQLWIDRSTHEPIRADFHVASGKLVKRAHYREFREMAGRRTVSRIEIDDLLRPGHRTVMKYSNLVARDNPERMFMKESLGR